MNLPLNLNLPELPGMCVSGIAADPWGRALVVCDEEDQAACAAINMPIGDGIEVMGTSCRLPY